VLSVRTGQVNHRTSGCHAYQSVGDSSDGTSIAGFDQSKEAEEDQNLLKTATGNAVTVADAAEQDRVNDAAGSGGDGLAAAAGGGTKGLGESGFESGYTTPASSRSPSRPSSVTSQRNNTDAMPTDVEIAAAQLERMTTSPIREAVKLAQAVYAGDTTDEESDASGVDDEEEELDDGSKKSSQNRAAVVDACISTLARSHSMCIR
jgi:hypothetical protein